MQSLIRRPSLVDSPLVFAPMEKSKQSSSSEQSELVKSRSLKDDEWL